MILSSYDKNYHAEIVDLADEEKKCTIEDFPDDRATFGTFIDGRLMGCDNDNQCFWYNKSNNTWILVMNQTEF